MVQYPPADMNPFANPFDRVVVVKNPVNYGTPYQVLFVTNNIGKHVSSAKREIKWRFGLANDKAIYSGLSGMACCGEEHEVKVIRTMNSGKRSVIVDNKEIHSSASRLDGKFEFTWTMCGYRKAKVTINRFPGPKSRFFDFTLDGVSFFDMPKISQLGTKREDVHPVFTNKSSPPITTAIISRSTIPSLRKTITIGPIRSRSCPAIATYKKKKSKEKRTLSLHDDEISNSMHTYDYEYPSSPSNTSSENITSPYGNDGRVEYNKLSGKYIISKSLPAHAAMC